MTLASIGGEMQPAHSEERTGISVERLLPEVGGDALLAAFAPTISGDGRMSRSKRTPRTR
jgi:hypothetical protein